MLSFAALLAVSIAVSSQNLDDQVTDLPGLNFKPQFEQFSGYLDLSNGHHLHYWLVTANDNIYPNDKPVTLWLNGGPGCSSLDGMLYEQGPIHVTENGTLYENKYAWNQYTNLLFLEAPMYASIYLFKSFRIIFNLYMHLVMTDASDFRMYVSFPSLNFSLIISIIFGFICNH